MPEALLIFFKFVFSVFSATIPCNIVMGIVYFIRPSRHPDWSVIENTLADNNLSVSDGRRGAFSLWIFTSAYSNDKNIHNLPWSFVMLLVICETWYVRNNKEFAFLDIYHAEYLRSLRALFIALAASNYNFTFIYFYNVVFKPSTLYLCK